MNDNLKMLIWAVIIIGAVFLFTNSQKSEQLAGGEGNFFYADSSVTTQHGSVWLSSAASTIVSRDNDRHFAIFTISEDATSTAFIWQVTSTDLVTTSGGVALNASTTSSYEINADNLYRGAIQGISDGDTQIFYIAQ